MKKFFSLFIAFCCTDNILFADFDNYRHHCSLIYQVLCFSIDTDTSVAMDDVEHVEVDLQLRPTGDVAVVLHLLSDDEGAQESLDGNGPPPESVLTSFEWSADANYMRDHMAKLVAFTPDLDVLRLSNCDSVTDHVLEILSPLTNLAWLDLSRCSYITDEGMPWLKSFSNLEHLDLDQCIGVGDAGIQELACLAKLTYLDIGRPPRDIWLSHISSYARQLPSKGEKITDSTLIALESLKQLEWLGLNYTDITGQGLAALSQYEQLERLELGGCDIADVEALCDIPQLKFLSLRNCDSVSDGTVVTLGKITQLMGLDLGGCDFITDDGLEPLMSLQELRTLSVARCKRLTHDGLLYIGYLYNLRHLDLSGLENLFGYGLDSLSQLNELWWLNLTGNKNVTDDGLKCLTSLQSLKLLGLGSCIKVTLDGLNHFLPYLKNLKFLDLSHTPRIRPRSRLAPLREKYVFVKVQTG